MKHYIAKIILLQNINYSRKEVNKSIDEKERLAAVEEKVKSITKTDHNSEAEILSYYNIMINSIKAYNQNVKIGIWLPPGKGIKNNSSNLLTRDKMLEMNKILIENFEDREDENLFLIPVNVCLNADLDYNTEEITISDNETYEIITDYTHPKMSGFNKIGEVLYYWIKYFGSLDE